MESDPSNPDQGQEPTPGVADDIRYDSWKDIASYLNRGITTVQRWEREEGLPVRRQEHLKKGSVYAFKSEIDGWRRGRERRLSVPLPTPVISEADRGVDATSRPPQAATTRARWRSVAVLLAMLFVTALAAASLSTRIAKAPASVARAINLPKALANDAASETSAAFSADGRQVAYLWRRPEAPGIYMKSPDGGAPRRLETGSFEFVGSAYVRWSPRGDVIAFLSGEDPSSRGVYTVSASGGTPGRLTTAAGIGLCWFPDGETLGFVDRTATSEPFSVFTVSLTTGARTGLTLPEAGTFGDTLCAVSPDGSHIAIARYSNRYQSDIFVADVSAPAGMRRRTVDLAGINGLTWMPDGRDLLVGTHDGLYLVPASGDVQPPLLVAAAGVAVHAPSAIRTDTGRVRVAFQSSVRDVNIYRWDVATSGSETTTRFAASSAWDTHPSISPDSRHVAFISNRTGFDEVWIASTTDHSVSQVSHHRGPTLTWPQFSPDGRSIAFSSHSHGNRDIFVIDADGSRSRRLTWEASHEDVPSWSRDGRWIYFRSDRGGTGRLWKLPAAGGAAIAVTRGEASQALESLDGTRLYFVRSTDTPGLWSMPVGGGEETLVASDVHEAHWALTESSLLYLEPWSELLKAPPVVHRVDLRTGAASRLLLPASGGPLLGGFAVDRSGGFVLWTQFERMQNDVMVIDSWSR